MVPNTEGLGFRVWGLGFGDGMVLEGYKGITYVCIYIYIWEANGHDNGKQDGTDIT